VIASVQDLRAAAKAAGDRAPKTAPLSMRRRADNYWRQLGGYDAGNRQATARQVRRARHKGNAAELRAKLALAGGAR
jgi:hypothetical protein